MPILDFLTEFDADNTASREDIGIKLNSVMLYPTRWQRREEFIVFHKIKTAQLKARTQYGQPVAKLTEDPEINEWLARLVDMQRNDGKNGAEIHAGSIAGLRLHYVAAIEMAGKKGSFNKADKLITRPYAKNSEKLKDQGKHVIHTSRTKIKEVWNEYRSVAHLWAAFNVYPALYGDESAFQHPERFIPLAEWFLEFGLEHKQVGGPNSGNPYLDPDTSWQSPKSFRFERLTETPEVIFWTCPTDRL